jgi:hypothetical protein
VKRGYFKSSFLDSISGAYQNLSINRIRNYLEASSDSTKIEVIKSGPQSPRDIGSFPVFEVKYGIEPW